MEEEEGLEALEVEEVEDLGAENDLEAVEVEEEEESVGLDMQLEDEEVEEEVAEEDDDDDDVFCLKLFVLGDVEDLEPRREVVLELRMILLGLLFAPSPLLLPGLNFSPNNIFSLGKVKTKIQNYKTHN